MAAIMDSIKWSPTATVVKYGPDSVQDIIRYLDNEGIRGEDRRGMDPSHDELRLLEAAFGLTPDEVTVAEGNILVSTGIDRITSLIIGAGGAAFTSVLGFIGVGATSTAEVIGNTALAGNGNSTTAWYQGLAGAPSRTTTTATNDTINASSTFGTADGNFAWNEWCWGIISSGTVTAANAIASTGATPIMLNRKTQSLGTKASGSTWTLQATIKLS